MADRYFSGADYDELSDAVTKVKAGAAVMTAMYLQDAGNLTYSAELFEVLAHELHDAARTFDAFMAKLGGTEA